jgi:hypothetical protein
MTLKNNFFEATDAASGHDHADVVPNNRIILWEVRAWTLLVIGVMYWANVVRSSGGGDTLSLVSVTNSLISEGAFNVLAWIVIFENVWALTREGRASSRQIWQAVVISAICVVPSKQAAAAGMVASAAVLYQQSKSDVFIRRIAMTLLALSCEIVWTSPYLDFFHSAVGRMDAHVVGTIHRALGHAMTVHGNIVENAANQFSIIVIAQCSSSYILAAMCLAFVVVALVRGREPRLSALGWLGAAYLASVALREVHLVLMASNRSNYEWWHNGPGYSIASLASTVLVGFFAVMATNEQSPATVGNAANETL